MPRHIAWLPVLRGVKILGLGAGLVLAGQQAPAQTGKFGTYSGTVKVSGTETGGALKRVNYGAELQLRVPVDHKSESISILEIGDVDKPSGIIKVTQYDLEERNASPNSDGKISSWKCQLAAPVTVPAMAQGTLNISYRRRTHWGFVTLATTEPVPLQCVHSRTGPYKESQPLTFFFGTNEADTTPVELPFVDAARLTAKHTLEPKSEMKGQYLPQAQEWEFTLRK
jgi:hypothetical protein